MWIDAAGVAHTVVLPEPSDVMSDEFRVSLDALIAADREVLLVILAQAEERIFEEDLSHPADPVDESAFEGLAPPRSMLEGTLADPDALEIELARVAWRWRLDMVLALGDYVD